MRIALDVTWMQEDNANGGGYHYTYHLIRTLGALGTHDIFPIVGTSHNPFASDPNLYTRVWHGDDYEFHQILNRERIDLLHAPVQWVSCYPRSIPLVTNIHDLQHKHFPQFFSQAELAFRDETYPRIAARSTRIIVSFAHVKADIHQFLGVELDKIDVCPVGINPPSRDADQVPPEPLLARYGLTPSGYLFYSANTWPHKNHVTLIKALRLLHEQYGNPMRLVCTGANSGPAYDDTYAAIREAVREAGLQPFVTFTGYIPEVEKNTLLANAAAAVLPTLYEAGCFPLLEAMARDVPVICSNVTSLPSQIGDARFLFDPMDAAAIAALADRMLNDREFREANVRNSSIQVKAQSWRDVVPAFIRTYERALKEYRKPSLLKEGLDGWREAARPTLRGRARNSASRIYQRLKR